MQFNKVVIALGRHIRWWIAVFDELTKSLLFNKSDIL
jgi:hypothetical protein